MCPIAGPLDPAARAQGCEEPSRRAADKSSIQRTVQAAYPKLETCHPSAASAQPAAKIEVTLRVAIGPEGQVFHAEIARSTLPDPAAHTCILRTVRELSFEPPYAGFLELEYPVYFGSSR